ncbi:MAG: hypothetical protein LBM23_07795 [Propionibacteriaceae bacterium]|jgi:hypothetical protein|nr:hypothetical protein [Propionibacteriaceae bacterium]
MRTLTARCERSGKWWAVTVDEMDNLFTQARRLDQVPMMVKDAVTLLTGQPESFFGVQLNSGSESRAGEMTIIG